MRGDQNAPAMITVPAWGPDESSLRLATLNLLFANPAAPPNIGIGVRPAPAGGSVTEGTKSDTWMQPQQNFRGFVDKAANPQIKNTPATASLPSAKTQINPVFVLMSQGQLNPNGGWPT